MALVLSKIIEVKLTKRQGFSFSSFFQELSAFCPQVIDNFAREYN